MDAYYVDQHFATGHLVLEVLHVILTVSAALAVGGVIAGLWPRRAGMHPTCAACGYDLYRLESDRCPECGAVLRGMRAIEIGRRYRRLNVAMMWATVCVATLVGRMVLQRHIREMNERPFLLAKAISAHDPVAVDALLKKDPSLVRNGATVYGLPLRLAVMEGNAKIVQRLIDAKADVKVLVSPQWTLLHESARKQREDVADVLLRAGADPAAVDSMKRTPLHWAAEAGSVAVVERLLADRAPVNARDQDGCTALHVALMKQGPRYDPAPVVRALLSAGADVNAVDRYGRTPLHSAPCPRGEPSVKLLLARGADPFMADHFGARPGDERDGFVIWKCVAELYDEQPDHARYQQVLQRVRSLERVRDVTGDTLLHCGARMGNADLVKLLLDQGVFVDSAGQKGRRPLHVAKDAATSALLIDRGAMVDPHDGMHMTPLHYAAAAGDIERVRLLLNRGANIRQTDNDGCGALHHAALARRAEPELLALLESAGSPVDIYGAIALGSIGDVEQFLRNKPDRAAQAPNRYGWQPLHIAAMYGRTAIARVLLDHGASVNVLSQFTVTRQRGVTPLMLAVDTQYLELVRLLVERGADVNAAEDRTRRTALHRAAAGDTAILELLVSASKNVDISDFRGNRAIHIAAVAGKTASVKLLLEHGAKAEGSDEAGYTAAQNAERAGHKELAQLLREAERPD